MCYTIGMTRTKKLKPRAETKKLEQPFTREAFGNIIKRAITTPAPKRAAK